MCGGVAHFSGKTEAGLDSSGLKCVGGGKTVEAAVKHRVSGVYRTVRAVVWKDGGVISPSPIRFNGAGRNSIVSRGLSSIFGDALRMFQAVLRVFGEEVAKGGGDSEPSFAIAFMATFVARFTNLAGRG